MQRLSFSVPPSYLTQRQESSKMVSANSILAALTCRTSKSQNVGSYSTNTARNLTLSALLSHSPVPRPPPSGELLALTCHGHCPALCQKLRGGCWDWDFPLPCAPTGAKSFELKSLEPPSWVQVAAGPRGSPGIRPRSVLPRTIIRSPEVRVSSWLSPMSPLWDRSPRLHLFSARENSGDWGLGIGDWAI